MKKDKTYYGSLLTEFFNNTLPVHQVNELLNWMRDYPLEYQEILGTPENQQQLKRFETFANIPEELSIKMHDRLIKAVTEQSTATNKEVNIPVKHIGFLKTNWLRYAAAILIVFGIGVYLLNTKQTKNPETALAKPFPIQNDILPGGNKAVLTLADGSTINLDSVSKGTLAQQGNTTVIKTEDGQLVYYHPSTGEAKYSTNGEMSFNTMSTPRGGQYQLLLPDGTKVWLNAASSITYPTTFSAKERRVSITGEAYFEVTKDPSKKFIVNSGSISTEVLGTHFNMNTYKDDEVMKITLLEGSVKIVKGELSNILRPGQQAQAKERDKAIKIINNADLNQSIAWKNGIFNFNKLPLKDVMLQLGRWYNVEIVYEKNLPNISFYGEIGRDLKLRQVLNGLSGLRIKFMLEDGKRLVVSKK